MLESRVEGYLVKKVAGMGGRAIKLESLAGLPDRLLLLPGGKACFVELKREGQKPRALQSLWLKRLSELGFVAVHLDSKEGINAFLSGFAKTNEKL